MYHPPATRQQTPFTHFHKFAFLPVFSNLKLVGQMKHQYHPITLDLKTRTELFNPMKNH